MSDLQQEFKEYQTKISENFQIASDALPRATLQQLIDIALYEAFVVGYEAGQQSKNNQ